MYICPTKPETPWLRNCPQFAVAKHHKWDVHTLHAITGHESARHITSSLYAAISSSFPLPFTQSCAKWFQICGSWLNSTYTLCERQRSYSAYCSIGACTRTPLSQLYSVYLQLTAAQREQQWHFVQTRDWTLTIQFASFPIPPCTLWHAQRGCLHFECMKNTSQGGHGDSILYVMYKHTAAL